MVRTWQLDIELDRASHVPLPQQLVDAVVRDVRAGLLPPGRVLPSSRTWARALGVHRNTVIAALDELKTQGWIESARASHVSISASLPTAPIGAATTTSPPPRVARAGASSSSDAPGFALPRRALGSRGFEASKRKLLDFTGGLPDPRLLPSSVLARAYRRALRRGGSAVLGFSDPAGHPRLRAAVAAMLRERRGLIVEPNDIVITRGSQHALHLLGLALLDAGDVVAVESPGYPSTREGFAMLGAHLLPIPVDDDGLDVDVLAESAIAGRGFRPPPSQVRSVRSGRSARNHAPVRAVTVTPLLQDPTTATLSPARRLQLLALARRARFAIIETDYDYEFQFDGAAVRPLAADDDATAGVVIYVGTLTKALAAGLRLGFIVAPPIVIDRVLAARAVVDRVGDAALELAVAELMEDGELMRYAWRARREFQRRRDVLVELLRKHLGDAVRFRVPRGGLALWVETPAIDVDVWAKRALDDGVRFFTGRNYDPQGRPLCALRLGFAHLDPQELVRAVEVMARTVPPKARARGRPPRA